MIWFLILAIALMIIGIVGSFTPMIPGALLSISGVLIYWWSTGYTSPGPVFVVLSVIAGLIALCVDWFAGAISAKAGGASNRTTTIAAVVGVALFFVAGPLGVIIGTAVTVFLMEFLADKDSKDSLKAAFYAVIGLLASSAMQFLLTVSILVFFLIGIIL
ncbi:MAG: DUF456 domain-containing protein [Candidatus Nanohaloarchaea archaeon]